MPRRTGGTAAGRTEGAGPAAPARVAGALVAVAVAALVAGCGGDDGGGTSKTSASGASGGSAAAQGGGAVKISNFAFVPAKDTVKVGARVAVSNDDSTAHTATADDGRSFDTGDIDPGASTTITLKRPGTYAYHCSIHPFMHGSVVAQ